MESSLAKTMLLTVLLVAGCSAASASNDSHNNGKVSFTNCGKSIANSHSPRALLYFRNVDLVLSELKTKTPVDGNFEHQAVSKSHPRVFGFASCFSSLTTSVETCTSCLEKAIRAVKKECRNSIRASAGTAAAGCSLRYDNMKIKT